MKSFLVQRVFAVLVVIPSGGALAQTTQIVDPNIQTVGTILSLPENQIDLARVKLTVDHIIDPRVDIERGLKQLDAMVATMRSKLRANASSRDKIDALRKHLYESGVWNGNQPFRYDLDDPLGHNVNNKLLTTYLSTRKGNCVSMPLLFVVLGQKLGIDVTVSTAPDHLFVKYRDETGNFYNLETTSGAGFTSDGWIQKQMPMTPQSLANGVYMQPLSKKQTVAVMLQTLMEAYGQTGQQESRIALADLTLKFYPNDVSAMLHISAGNYRLMARDFMSKYKTPREIPREQHAYFAQLNESVRHWREKAEALGWREPDKAAQSNYQQVVNLAKTAQQGGTK